MSAEKQQKSEHPQVIRLDKAFKLAEQWVKNMSKVVEDEATEEETKARPLNLGLGAKVVHPSKVVNFDNPVERNLHAKLEAGKRKAAAKEIEERGGNDNDSDDDSDEESESRTSAFAKKIKGPPPGLSLQVKKKQK
ncbi:uncharacterized protein LOC126682642 [Mercurialis annua]|uniref:uncharacterized protein LOC126682642 n=1 Tax=Mercurialis annua TaxID=3986 RepID=UPI00215DE0A3|nr:uncharacterized protein LOC126682642 [Mercurialis annua]